jgi:hypothetical protein
LAELRAVAIPPALVGSGAEFVHHVVIAEHAIEAKAVGGVTFSVHAGLEHPKGVIVIRSENLCTVRRVTATYCFMLYRYDFFQMI